MMMDGLNLDWCVCGKATMEGALYCSAQCRDSEYSSHESPLLSSFSSAPSIASPMFTGSSSTVSSPSTASFYTAPSPLLQASAGRARSPSSSFLLPPAFLAPTTSSSGPLNASVVSNHPYHQNQRSNVTSPSTNSPISDCYAAVAFHSRRPGSRSLSPKRQHASVTSFMLV